jgi:hypothetical protein
LPAATYSRAVNNGGFFDKAPCAKRRRFVAFRGHHELAALDVAESRLRMRRRDPEGYEQSLRRERCRARDSGRERARIANQMVGRQHEQNGVVPSACLREQCAERNCRRRITAEGLEQIHVFVRGRDARARVDVLRVEVEIAIRHGDQAIHRGQVDRTPGGFAQQRLAVGKRHERLRRRLAGKRPQPRAGPAGKDQRNERRSSHARRR